MTPATGLSVVCSRFAGSDCFKSARNRQAIDKINENASCFTVSPFWGNAAREILNLDRQSIKNPEAYLPKTMKWRNREHFTSEYQYVVCFTRFETA